MIASLLQEKDELASNGHAPHLSHTRINRYLLCPEQYRLYYVENLRPKTPPATLVFGQIVHQSIAQLFQKKGDPVRWFEDSWGVLKDMRLTYKERDSWDKLKYCGEGLLTKFVSDEFPKISDIRAVEKPFEFAITGIDSPFIGVIDLEANLCGTPSVVDFKTAASAYDDHDVKLSDQLTAYKLAKPGTDQFALCVLVKTKEPKIEWHLTRRSGKALGEYLEKVGYLAREISSGRFYKRPGKWCSWCDFLPICLGNHTEASETLVKIA